jgi:hypothetical protein
MESTAGTQSTKKAKSLAQASIHDKKKGEAIRVAAMTTQAKRTGKYKLY